MLCFQHFLTLRGKKYGSSKLSVGDQLAFDTFLEFTRRRRIMKAKRWLKDLLDDESAKARAQLEQRYITPFELRFARCQHKCARCQLGCMRSVYTQPRVNTIAVLSRNAWGSVSMTNAQLDRKRRPCVLVVQATKESANVERETTAVDRSVR